MERRRVRRLIVWMRFAMISGLEMWGRVPDVHSNSLELVGHPLVPKPLCSLIHMSNLGYRRLLEMTSRRSDLDPLFRIS
jgi:hypothetical protein